MKYMLGNILEQGSLVLLPIRNVRHTKHEQESIQTFSSIFDKRTDSISNGKCARRAFTSTSIHLTAALKISSSVLTAISSFLNNVAKSPGDNWRNDELSTIDMKLRYTRLPAESRNSLKSYLSAMNK